MLAVLVRVVELAADLWWPRLLQLFVFLLGMVLMGAMGFTLSQVVRHRELVAMLASGISLRRAARPILLVAALMTLVQVLDQELVLPRIAPLLTRDHGDAGKHELQGFAVRVPVPTGSLVDLTIEAERATTVAEVNDVFRTRADRDELAGILRYSEEPLVSTDIVKSPYSAIFDAPLTTVVDGTQLKVVAWYDNEWGYSNRLVELAERVFAPTRERVLAAV